MKKSDYEIKACRHTQTFKILFFNSTILDSVRFYTGTYQSLAVQIRGIVMLMTIAQMCAQCGVMMVWRNDYWHHGTYAFVSWCHVARAIAREISDANRKQIYTKKMSLNIFSVVYLRTCRVMRTLRIMRSEMRPLGVEGGG